MLKKLWLKDIFTDSLVIFIIKVFGAGMSFLFTIIISNKYDASGVGLFYLAISVLNILMLFSKLGMENAIIKYVSILKQSENAKAISGLKRSSTKLTLSISIAGTVVCILGSGVICNYIFHKSNLRDILIFIVIANIPFSISMILVSFLKGFGDIKHALFLESAFIPTLNVILILITIYWFRIESFIMIGFTYLFTTVILLAVVLIRDRKVSKTLKDNNDELFEFKTLLITARPLLLVASTNYLLSSTDTLMLGIMRTEAEVGIYNIASKITMLPSMLLVAVNTVLGPRFSVLFYQNKLDELKRLLQKTSRFMLMIAVVIYSLFIFSAKLIVWLFGSSFAGVEPIIYVVSIGQLFLLATGPVATLLMMTGNEKLHRDNTLYSTLLNIVFNAIFIPLYGAFGAALATSMSIIIKNVVATILVYKKLHIFIYW